MLYKLILTIALAQPGTYDLKIVERDLGFYRSYEACEKAGNDAVLSTENPQPNNVYAVFYDCDKRGE